MTCPNSDPKAPHHLLRKKEDKLFQWSVLERASKNRRDPAGYLADCKAAIYATEGDYVAMSRKSAETITRKWRTPTERLKARGVTIAGPGTVLARWIHVVVLVLTLGVVEFQCSGCATRAAKLDKLGWSGMVKPWTWRR